MPELCDKLVPISPSTVWSNASQLAVKNCSPLPAIVVSAFCRQDLATVIPPPAPATVPSKGKVLC